MEYKNLLDEVLTGVASREVVLISLLLSWMTSCGAPAPEPVAPTEGLMSVSLSEELSIREVVPDVFVVEHRFPWAANSLLVKVSGHELVFVDTPYTRLATQEVMEWLERTFGKVSVIEINTGYHVDNLGGNEYLQRAGVPVYGSFLTDRLLREKGEETQKEILKWLSAPEHESFYYAHKSMSLYPPTQLFQAAEGLRFEFADGTVEAFYPGPSHAEDNLVVYFSEKKVLFGGCMIKSLDAENLGFTKDANLEAWSTSVERVTDRYEQAEIVVPGHGAPGDKELLDHTLALLEKTKEIGTP
jgi:metallo-beta-lactamase class B